jgi:dTDP-4-amino-4,6-dideoxygalactose transaminase
MDKEMRKIGVGTFKTTHLMRQHVMRVLETGQLSYGDFSRQFEDDFALMHNCTHGVLSNSGTSSLLVALQTLKRFNRWQDGDEVLVPACTFVATVNIVLQAGLRPVLVDVEEDHYAMNPALIEQKLRAQTKCIIPVHPFGQPANMNMIKPIANNYGLKIIEDSCECILAKHDGASVGAWSDISCFSFYMAHLLTAGVGGIALTNDAHMAKYMRSLVNHGMKYDDLSNDKTAYFRPKKTHRDFIFDKVGHSFRITEFEAAIATAQLETIYDDIVKRRENAAYLTKHLSGIPALQLPKIREDTEHSFMMYPIVMRGIEKGENKKDLIKWLNEHGISTRSMLPLINQPVYRKLKLWNPEHYPVAQDIEENGFYIGCHQHLTKEDLDYIVSRFERYFFDLDDIDPWMD